ncbi:hypothetical protein [Amycolatopsis sp. NPDC051903]|uniref:hypothetical protein n=1 Tax=Amycolatopsis sp. NPDC051903 TaxID=3363936 RepID=UPI0037BCFA73
MARGGFELALRADVLFAGDVRTPCTRRCYARGNSAADHAVFDVAMPLFESGDVRRGLASAIAAYQAGRPRPVLAFDGE